MKVKLSLSAVILAAGHSSRFGSCKALSQIENASALEHCIKAFRESAAFRENAIQSIIVVTGAWKNEVEASVSEGCCDFVHNSRFDKGMFSSVQTGMNAVARDCDAVFIHPVDIPLVSPSTITLLARAYAACNPEKWCVPVLRGREGHPVLLPYSYKKLTRHWDGDGGLRGFLALREREKAEVPVLDEGILKDMDTPEDRDKLIAYAKRRHIPGRSTIDTLLKMARTPSHVISHQHRVAEVALKIGRLYVQYAPLDLELLSAAAELHDILKEKADHAEKGGEFLKTYGFFDVAQLVQMHTDISDTASMEAKILYLADKYVYGMEVESLQKREERVKKKFASNKAALKAASRRMKIARDIEKHLERVTSLPSIFKYIVENKPGAES